MTIIVETVSIDEIKERISQFFKRLFRPRIFKAIESGNDERVLALAARKKFLLAKGMNGESPLVACIGKQKSELACKLIDLGGFYNGDGALNCAAMWGDQKVVDRLLQCGVDPNDSSGNPKYHEGKTALMWATNRHYFGIIKSLLEAGADINAVSKDKSTAAMCTRNADEDDLRALKMLLEYRPDISIRDWRGRNLIQEAQDRVRCSGRPEMLDLLKQYYPDISSPSA